MGGGIFLTIEGGEGAGKSTQARILAQRLEVCGFKVALLHEPGGTPAGERVRSILLNPACELNPVAELLLFEAARAQLVSQVIQPALSRGEVVICDRYTDSTIAYQGFARGLGAQCVQELNKIATGGCMPQRTILLDVDAQTGLSRARGVSGSGGDRMERENLSFYEAVRCGFNSLAAAEPERIRVILPIGDVCQTAAAVWDALADLFGGQR